MHMQDKKRGGINNVMVSLLFSSFPWVLKRENGTLDKIQIKGKGKGKDKMWQCVLFLEKIIYVW